MRDNEKLRDEKLNIDALLRDVAKQQNAALKLDDIKQGLLQKVREGNVQAPEPADEFSARRDKKARIRKMTIGFASAAAALLLLLSAKNMLSRSNLTDQAAPQEQYAAVAPEAKDSTMERADMLALPAPEAQPETPAAMPPVPAAEAPATEAPTSEAPATEPQLGAMQSPAGGGGGGETAQSTQDNGTRSLTGTADESVYAIEAVRAALLEAGRAAEAEGAYADAVLVENAEFSLLTLTGDSADVQSISLYVVSLGADGETAKKFAVDPETFKVYGEIV